jgi:tetratricopeptide (TPR) repeat protein
MAGNQAAFQKAMNQGHSAAWDQDWRKAAEYYSLALEEFPENALALSSLGLAYFELADYERALECYQHAARVAPTDPVPQEKMARIYERMGRLKEAAEASLIAAELHLRGRDAERAIDNWVHVLSLYPEHLSTRQRLAAVYERLGRREEAVHEYIAVASLLQHSGDLTRALKSAEYAARLAPESQEARFALHTLRSNQVLPRPARPKGGTGPMRMASVKELESGAQGSEQELQLDPVDETRQKALVQLAALLFEQAEEAEAEPASRRGLSALTRGAAGPLGGGSDKTRVILHLGQAIDSQTEGDLTQAAVELERAFELGLRTPAAAFDLGLLYRGRDDEKALRYLRDSVKHPDYTLGASLLLAQIHAGRGQWNEAAASYMRALAMADAEMVPPEQADELRQMYEPMIDALGSDTDQASLQSVCKTIASQLQRADWRTFLRMARQNLPPQPPGSPLTPVAEMLLESHSGTVVELIGRVRELAAREMTRSAMEEAYFALQLAPAYLPVHIEIAELLLREGRMEEAVRKFMIVADLYNTRGESARAVRILQRVLEVAPMNLNVRERLIELLVAQEKTDEALKQCMELAENYYRLADLDKSRQTYLEALKVAQQSKNNRAWGVEILSRVADIDMQRLNFRQALRIFEQIRTIQPDNQATRMQIIQLQFRLGQPAAAIGEADSYINLLESSGRRGEAIEFLNLVLKEGNDNLDLRRRLADLYAREGRVDEAVSQLDTVADAYAGQGKMLEAINILEMIVALKPKNVEDYRQALMELRRQSLRR